MPKLNYEEIKRIKIDVFAVTYLYDNRLQTHGEFSFTSSNSTIKFIAKH